MTDNTNKELLTIKEVAKIFKMGVSTIWAKVARGEFIPPIKDGGSTRWHPDDVEQYLLNKRPYVKQKR